MDDLYPHYLVDVISSDPRKIKDKAKELAESFLSPGQSYYAVSTGPITPDEWEDFSELGDRKRRYLSWQQEWKISIFEVK